MNIYEKIPERIMAYQLTKDNKDVVFQWAKQYDNCTCYTPKDEQFMLIIGANHVARFGDFIVLNVSEKKLSVCTKDEFEKMYRIVSFPETEPVKPAVWRNYTSRTRKVLGIKLTKENAPQVYELLRKYGPVTFNVTNQVPKIRFSENLIATQGDYITFGDDGDFRVYSTKHFIEDFVTI